MNVSRRAVLTGAAAGSLVAATGGVPTLAGPPVVGPVPEGKISLAEFLGSSGPLDDYTDVFAKAIGAAAARKTGTLQLPAGRFPLRRLVLPSNVAIVGSGRNTTVLVALPSDRDSLIALDTGPVQSAGLRSLRLQGGSSTGATNAGQWAMRLTSAPAREGKAHGGLWWSIFEDVTVTGFDHGLWFDGGQDNFLLPHQFVSLRDMVITGPKDAVGPGIRMSGQVNQFVFSQVHVDHFRGRGIEILKSENGKTSPKLHHFDVCTIQNAEQAVIVSGAHNIAFSNCWFEADGAGVRVEQQSVGVSVAGCRFANSGSTGAAVAFAAATTGEIRGNVFAGPKTAKSIEIAEGAVVTESGSSFIWGAKR